ncbi:MAG: hypothetical protein ACC662_02815 [Planctomycetota bacterium]
MRYVLAASVAVVILGFSALSALALDEVILNDGSVRHADILEVLENGIRVKFRPKSGGKVEMVVPASKLDPAFFYALRKKAIGDNAEDHLKLALWAFDAGLFARAKAQIEEVARLDPQLVKDIEEGKLPEIREGIARKVLESAQKDVKKGRLERAEQKLQALLARMPDTGAGTEAVGIYKALLGQVEEKEAKLEEQRLAKMEEDQQKAERELRKKVEPIKRDLKAGKKYLSDGLTEDSESKALDLLKRAIQKGGAALQKLDKLAKDNPDDADLQQRIADVRRKTIAGMVQAYIQRADIYTWRAARTMARKELKKARELDPENPDITAAEGRVDDSESDDALGLRWQRNRREGLRFGGRGLMGGARGGGFGGGRR